MIDEATTGTFDVNAREDIVVAGLEVQELCSTLRSGLPSSHASPMATTLPMARQWRAFREMPDAS